MNVDTKELEVHINRTLKREEWLKWASGFCIFGKEIAVKACFTAVKLVLPIWEDHPEIELFDSSSVLRAIDIVESWLQLPSSQNAASAKAYSPVIWETVEKARFVFDEYSGDTAIVSQRESALLSVEAIAYTIDAVAWTPEA